MAAAQFIVSRPRCGRKKFGDGLSCRMKRMRDLNLIDLMECSVAVKWEEKCLPHDRRGRGQKGDRTWQKVKADVALKV
jgi:hypothetical protein